MPRFASFDGTPIHYEVRGEGRPVVLLLHSFCFEGGLWERQGLVGALVDAGMTTITPDARAHGESGKPHESSAYTDDAMARDVEALIDHLELESVDLVAYSMGSIVGLRVLQLEPRIRRAVLGGVGERARTNYFANRSLAADALEADDIASLVEPLRALRTRVERKGGDRFVLAALMRAQYVDLAPDFDHVRASVLILTGERDNFGSPQPIADAIPNGRAALVDADHENTLDHPDFTPTVVAFLK